MTRDEINAAHPLVEYCEARGWTMRRSGTEWSCRCPLPNHEDRNPSFYVNPAKQVWKCHGCGRGGSVIDLHMVLHNMTDGEAMADLGDGNRDFHHEYQPPPPKREKYDPFRDEEKSAKRARWPTFDIPTKEEIEIVAELRGLSVEGVNLAVESGLLFCADSREGPRAWIITDSRRVNAQARRLDGGTWAHIGGRKAWTLPGSVASWPIGIREAQNHGAIALVEGGPDLLAAYHLIWIANQEVHVAPVAMLGASNDIPAQALPLFANKRVRIFAHRDDDGKGFEAEKRWWNQLLKVGARVDGYSFANLITSTGAPVNDLNDFCHVGVDQWGSEWPDFDQAFVL